MTWRFVTFRDPSGSFCGPDCGIGIQFVGRKNQWLFNQVSQPIVAPYQRVALCMSRTVRCNTTISLRTAMQPRRQFLSGDRYNPWDERFPSDRAPPLPNTSNIISVRTALGLTALSRIPYRPYSTAAEWVWTVVIVTGHLSDHVFWSVEIAVRGVTTRPVFRSSKLTIWSSPGSR